MSSATTGPLAGRSPSARKSLSAVSTAKKSHSAHRKRAKSIASTNPEELTPRSKRRRSLVPKKSILKQSNGGNLTAPLPSLGSSQLEQRPSPLDDVTLNFTRTSRQSTFNGDRRVSFAPNAHVRLIPKDQPVPGLTPPSSPGESTDGSPNTSQENTRPSPSPSPSKPASSSRRSSIRQSFGDGEGEQSMDLASDNSYLDEESIDSSKENSSANDNRRDSSATEGSSMDIDDSQEEVDMDITTNMSVATRYSIGRPRRSSTRPPKRQSTARRESNVSEGKPTEYTVGLEESLKGDVQPSESWLLLKAATNVGKENDVPAEQPTPAVDMDLKTAAERLLKAGQDIPLVGHPQPGEEDETISSSGDSTASLGGKTMDFTSLTGGIHRMSMVASEAPPAPTNPGIFTPAPATTSAPVEPPASTSAPTPASSSIPVPKQAASAPRSGIMSIFTPKALFGPKPPATAPRSASSSPVKVADSSPIKAAQRSKPPAFSAAFAPPSTSKGKGPAFTLRVPSSLVSKSPSRQTPQKRPLPVEEGTPAVESTPKKLIIEAEDNSKALAIPKPSPVKATPVKSAPATPKSPARKTGLTPRKPSDYLTRPSMSRKVSIVAPTAPATPAAASPERPPTTHTTPSKTPGPIDVGTPLTPAPKSPHYAQPISTHLTEDDECAKETSRQLDAEISITASPRSPMRTPKSRRSFMEASLVTSPWLSKVKRPSTLSALGDEDEEETSALDSLSSEARSRLPRSVDELLRLVGGEFMDNMAARRRSTMALRVKDQCEDGPPNSGDFATAMVVDFPMLDYYDFLVRHLENHIDQLEQKQRETDMDVEENPPPCFIDYATGGPEQLPELKGMLESLRNLARLRTKNQWYHWRVESIKDLYKAVDVREKKALQDLGQTQTALAEVNAWISPVQSEHAQIMAELERERAAVLEIEKCDQKALAEVKSTIADYATQLKMLEEEMAELQLEIDNSQKKAEEYKSERGTLQRKMEVATKICTTGHVKEDLMSQTRDDIKLLQLSTRWAAMKVSPSLVTLEYDQRFIVNLPCNDWVPDLGLCSISMKTQGIAKRRRDWIPAYTKFCMESANRCLAKGKFGRLSIKKIISKLSTYWTCCETVRLELMMLRSKYWVTFRSSPSGKNLIVETSVLYEKSAAKVLLDFELSPRAIESWPRHIQDIKTRVHLAYALDDNVAIDTDSVLNAVVERLQQANLSENFGVLLEACLEADALYQ